MIYINLLFIIFYMESTKLPQACPSCDGSLIIERLYCEACRTLVEGRFDPPRLARLPAEDQRFLELFVLSGGSLKRISQRLAVSYPTVRKRLDELIAKLEAEIAEDETYRMHLLMQVGEGKLSAREAANELKKLQG